MLCIHHINSNSEAWPFRRRHNVHQPYHRHAINVHGNTGEQSDFYLISKDDLSLYYRNIIHKRQPLSRLFSLRRSHYDSFGVSISFDSILLSDPTQPSSSSFDILFRLWAALEIFEIFQTCHSSESVQALVTIGGKDVTLLLMVEMCKMVKLCSDFPSQGLAPPPSPTPLPPPPLPQALPLQHQLNWKDSSIMRQLAFTLLLLLQSPVFVSNVWNDCNRSPKNCSTIYAGNLKM